MRIQGNDRFQLLRTQFMVLGDALSCLTQETDLFPDTISPLSHLPWTSVTNIPLRCPTNAELKTLLVFWPMQRRQIYYSHSLEKYVSLNSSLPSLTISDNLIYCWSHGKLVTKKFLQFITLLFKSKYGLYIYFYWNSTLFPAWVQCF